MIKHKALSFLARFACTSCAVFALGSVLQVSYIITLALLAGAVGFYWLDKAIDKPSPKGGLTMLTYKGYIAKKGAYNGCPKNWWTVRDINGNTCIQMGGTQREVKLAIDRYARAGQEVA